VKGLERLTCIRLAEVLTQRSSVENDVITDALYAQDRHGESFVEILISAGSITEWDLAKLVVEHFQIPFLMAGTYDISPDILPEADRPLLYEHMLVPLDRFENVLTVVMPILTPLEMLARVKAKISCRVFPYVGLISENRKVLAETFKDYPAWAKRHEQELEQRRQNRKPSKANRGPGDWMDIFDSADAQVRDSLGSRKK